jgi:sulfate transport system substrate-binding protein
LVKAEKQGGEGDRAKALQTLQAIWRNVISTPASAREARTTFELGNGDALITYELDGLLMKQNNAKADAEIVVPDATILSEHPVVVIDRNVGAMDRQVIDAFVQYLWTEEAQRAFVKSNFRASINDDPKCGNKELATIKYPFTVDYFGGGPKLTGNNREHFSRSGAKEKIIWWYARLWRAVLCSTPRRAYRKLNEDSRHQTCSRI